MKEILTLIAVGVVSSLTAFVWFNLLLAVVVRHLLKYTVTVERSTSFRYNIWIRRS